MRVRARSTTASPLAHDTDYRRTLIAEAAVVGVPLDAGQVAQFLRYLELLRMWRARARLTAITRPAAVIRLHFADSLLCLKARIPSGAQLLDVGSGAGFPGVPLVIVRPDVSVVLLEAATRKAAFLEVLSTELGLALRVVRARAETAAHEAQWREQFDVATARAVAPLATLCELTFPFVRPGGKVVLLKGPSVRAEMRAGERAAGMLGGGMPALTEAPLAGGERRILVTIPKPGHTPPGYPRRPGVPGRSPLGREPPRRAG